MAREIAYLFVNQMRAIPEVSKYSARALQEVRLHEINSAWILTIEAQEIYLDDHLPRSVS